MQGQHTDNDHGTAESIMPTKKKCQKSENEKRVEMSVIAEIAGCRELTVWHVFRYTSTRKQIDHVTRLDRESFFFLNVNIYKIVMM